MRPRSTLALAHAIVIAVLHWPAWALGVAALVLWGLAFLGSGEPQPTRGARHADVRRNEQTALGQALMFREGWIIERPALCIGLIIVVSIAISCAFVALTPATEDPQTIARVFAWTPALLLGGGFLLARMVNIWALSFTLTGLWLLFTVLFTVQGEGMTALRLACGGLSVVASLWCTDLLRGAGRALERRRKHRMVVDGIEVPRP